MSRRLSVAVLPLALALGGCPGESGPDPDDLLGDVVRLDDASEEVLAIIADHVDREGVTVSDAAAQLNAPDDAALLPRDPAMTVAWTLPPITTASGPWWHGIDTGTFVWIRIDGGTLAEPIDIVALTTEQYQISPTRWVALMDAGGPFTATITTTVVDRAVIVEGPFQPADADVQFSIE